MAVHRSVVLVLLVALALAVRSTVPLYPPAVGAWSLEPAFLLGFLLLAAHVTGTIARDFGLPRITGYLLAGLALGPAGLGLVTDADLAELGLINEIAIALIALSAGLELDLADVRRRGRSITAILALEMTAVFVAVVAAVWAMRTVFPPTAGQPLLAVGVIAVLFGSIAIANSPAVAVAVINDNRSRGPVTSTMLGVTVLKDVLVIVLFAVTVSLARGLLGGGGALGLDLVARLWWEVGGSLLLGALVGWVASHHLERWQGRPILLVLVTAITVVWLCRALHLEILLTALATGLFVENVGRARAEPFVRAVEVNSLTFYALFFTLAGASIHVDTLRTTWPFVVALVAVRTVAIWTGTRLGAALGDATPAVRRWAWTGFVSQAGVALGMVTIAAEAFPEFGVELKAVFVAMVAVHELGGPVLMQWGLRSAGEVGAADVGAEAPKRRTPPGPGPEGAHVRAADRRFSTKG